MSSFAPSLTLALLVCLAGAPGQKHWSFRPITTGPAVAGNPVELAGRLDALVAERRRAAGLTANPPADRRTLIRRLYLDVLGLPPSPTEVAAFVGDRRAGAYARLVDRVLASPRFGERQAQHWLDVVRYADTHGFEVNTPRPNAWPYRDWVIEAFNTDLPYDAFVQQQLAGDALGADRATGFLVAGPAVLPGQVGKDDLSKRQARQDELDEIVKATSGTFLGLTVSCARCHDHKFDPIRQADYYAMQAVFAGVFYGERPLPDPERERSLAATARQIAELTREALAFEPLADPGEQPGIRRAAVSSRHNIERIAPVRARFVRFTTLATNSKHEPCIDELEVFCRETGRNVALATAGAKATASGTYPNSAIHRLPHIHDGRYGNGRSWISNEVGKGWVQIELAATTTIDRIEWARDRELRYADRTPTAYVLEVAETGGDWHRVASAADRAPTKDTRAYAPAVAHLDAATRARAEALHAALAGRRAEHARLRKGRRIFGGTFRPAAATHRLHRGNPLTPKELVHPDAPAVLGALALPAETDERGRRLAFAQWLTSPTNPLTPRVLVNRLWQHHFGTGLVDTPSDFGKSGTRPSHPALLDWLAGVLVAGGWSQKHVHRTILLSATYRQASTPRPDALRRDAGNRLLWRFAPRRLSAEAIRDSILAVTGALDLRMGGRGFSLFEPNNNYVRVYEPRTEWPPATLRRMIYSHKVRMEKGGVFGAFDCPDAGQAAPKRSRSTTPMQALNLFNSTFILQQAARLAQAVAPPGSTVDDQVATLFDRVLGRPPTTREGRLARAHVAAHGLPALSRVLLNTNEFLVLP